MSVLTDPADCGPVTLGLCQDVQAEAWDYPESFFTPRLWSVRRVRPDEGELDRAVAALLAAKRPLIVCGGGVRYSGASQALADFAERTGIPVAATQAGKSAMVEDHELYVGSLGVTGASAANSLAGQADVVLSVGSRLQDFTTGSNSLIKGRVIALNVQAHDLVKHDAMPLMGDALGGIEALSQAMGAYSTGDGYRAVIASSWDGWIKEVADVCDAPTDSNALPSDSQVIGAVNRACPPETIVVGAAGSMPG